MTNQLTIVNHTDEGDVDIALDDLLALDDDTWVPSQGATLTYGEQVLHLDPKGWEIFARFFSFEEHPHRFEEVGLIDAIREQFDEGVYSYRHCTSFWCVERKGLPPLLPCPRCSQLVASSSTIKTCGLVDSEEDGKHTIFGYEIGDSDDEDAPEDAKSEEGDPNLPRGALPRHLWDEWD